MNKRKIGYILAVSATVILSILILSGCSKTAKSKSSSNTKSNSVETSSPNQSDQASGVGTYDDYTPQALAATASSDKVVLFFHATLCSTCQGIDKDIKANLDSIPGDVKIFKVDYDSEKDLEKKYGVRQQYTMVQVDNSGKKIGLWTDSFSLNDILDTIA